MRPDKYTQKMQEALQTAQSLASEFNQPEITNEHFLLALLDQTDGVTRPLLEKIAVSPEGLEGRLRTELNRRPKVQGAGYEVRLSNESRAQPHPHERQIVKLEAEVVAR